MKQWIINLMLLFATIVAIGFSLLRIVPFEVSEATYVGIIVTFMGVIVTILVGYQIYNSIEIKRDIEKQRAEFKREIENQKEELKNDIEGQKQKSTEITNRLLLQDKNLTTLNYEIKENLYIVLSFIYESENKTIAVFEVVHSSLLCSMYNKKDDYDWILNRLKSIIQHFNYKEIYSGGICYRKGEYYTTQTLLSSSERKLSDVVEKYIEPIKEVEKEIRKNEDFKIIALVYNPIMQQFYQKIEELKNPYPSNVEG